jgi:hypothetical protein
VGGGDDVAASSELLAVNGSASDTNLLKVPFSPEAPEFERGKIRAILSIRSSTLGAGDRPKDREE